MKNNSMSTKELINSFKINKKTEDTSKKKSVSIRYNKNGLDDAEKKAPLSDDKTVAVKTILPDKNVLYKIRCKLGRILYDPRMENNTYNLSAKDDVKNSPMFAFVGVNQKCFDDYIMFLKTKKGDLLTSAQREVI